MVKLQTMRVTEKQIVQGSLIRSNNKNDWLSQRFVSQVRGADMNYSKFFVVFRRESDKVKNENQT